MLWNKTAQHLSKIPMKSSGAITTNNPAWELRLFPSAHKWQTLEFPVLAKQRNVCQTWEWFFHVLQFRLTLQSILLFGALKLCAKTNHYLKKTCESVTNLFWIYTSENNKSIHFKYISLRFFSGLCILYRNCILVWMGIIFGVISVSEKE